MNDSYREIIPAILPKDRFELEKKMTLLQAAYSLLKEVNKPIVQIDICDGVFVPTKTWNYLGGVVEDLVQFSDDFDFEIDLMVVNPKEVVADWQKINTKRIVLHIESLVGNYTNFFEKINVAKTQFGFAINLTTAMKDLDLFKKDADFFQFMGINRIGYQGEKFKKETLKKIRAFCRENKNIGIPVSVDGGVNLKTGKKLVAAGASRLVVGSALFGDNRNAEEMAEIIRKFRQFI